jgi:hypothetical protein
MPPGADFFVTPAKAGVQSRGRQGSETLGPGLRRGDGGVVGA